MTFDPHSIARRLAAGDIVGASRLLRRALCLDPGVVACLGSLGLARFDGGDWEGAIVAFRRALALSGMEPATLINLGAAEEKRKRREAAEGAYRAAAALAPELPLAPYNLALLTQARGDVERAIVLLRRTLSLTPDDAVVHSNLIFSLAYRADFGSRNRAAETLRWSARHAQVTPIGGSWSNKAEPDRRLRIGYLSADLRAHPVAQNLIGLLRHHDPRQVEIALYSVTPTEDRMTEALRGVSGRWCNLVGSDDETIARRIHADGIDILVNVAAHTGHNRPRVPAYRPAPVQANLFDLGTSGVAEVDYLLSDAVATPPHTSELFVETIERLPWLCTHELPEDSPPVTPLPAAKAGKVVFASINNPAKVSPETVVVWSRILGRIPEARLRLKYLDAFADRRTRERFEALFAASGVGPERIEFLSDGGSVGDHLAQLGSADIALDPFPFNGWTATFQALWMGLPVVSLAGSCFMGRIGASFLTTVGLPELVAATEDAYVGVAEALAADVGRLAALRAGMRSRVQASPLCRPADHAREVEAAYRRMWRRWCARIT